MTLCIAAACQEDGKPRIVLCTDWKSSSALGASQTADKLRWVKRSPLWLALTAGKQRAIESIVRYYRQHLENVNLTDATAQRTFDHIARAQLARRKGHAVERELGVRYSYFRSHRSEFPDTVQQDMFSIVRRTSLDAQLLIVGFTLGTGRSPVPLICKVDSDASTEVHPHNAAVGEGMLVALPSLIRRGVDREISLKKAVYEVYEAKTLAETVPSVGDDTSIDIFYPDGSLKSLTDAGYKYLDRKLKRYGPKEKVTRLERFVREGHLENLPFSSLS